MRERGEREMRERCERMRERGERGERGKRGERGERVHVMGSVDSKERDRLVYMNYPRPFTF